MTTTVTSVEDDDDPNSEVTLAIAAVQGFAGQAKGSKEAAATSASAAAASASAAGTSASASAASATTSAGSATTATAASGGIGAARDAAVAAQGAAETARDGAMFQRGRAEAAANSATSSATAATASQTAAAGSATAASGSANAAAASATAAQQSAASVAPDPPSYAPVLPSLDLALTSPEAVDPAWFSRLGTAYRIRASGLLESVAAGGLRIDHDPVTGANRGLLIEEPRTTLTAKSRRLDDNTVWTATGLTTSAVAGADGVAGSATRLTATGANATILAPPTTSASAARRLDPYIRRAAGTGNIDLTLDGGTTWTTLVGITSTYIRLGIGQTLANPRVGLRIASSGDQVDVDFLGGETGATATSPIESGAAVTTRAADNLSVPTASDWFSQIGVALIGILQYLGQNWQGDVSSLPFPLSMVLGFLPPWAAPAIIVAMNIYNALAAQGIVKARVQAERTGLHNGEPEPAPSPSDGPRLPGIFGSLFGAR